jgi:hypothetical protein
MKSLTNRSLSVLADDLMSWALRPLFRHAISRKRISWFFFQQCLQPRSKDSTKSCITIKSENLMDFLGTSPANTGLVLAGGSDHDVTQQELRQMSNLNSVKFFVQNLDFEETENIKLLPIGVQDMKWARSGMAWNYRRQFRRNTKKSKILVGPFGMTHSERIRCLNSARASSLCDVKFASLSSYGYAKLSSEYLFIACPRGNGLDTHRLWETLYRGSIPVLVSSNFSKTLLSYGLPVAEISDWDDLLELDQRFVERNLEMLRNANMSYLKQSWWINRFTAALD